MQAHSPIASNSSDDHSGSLAGDPDFSGEGGNAAASTGGSKGARKSKRQRRASAAPQMSGRHSSLDDGTPLALGGGRRSVSVKLEEDEESLSLARLQEEYAVLKQVNEVLVKRNNQQELAVVRASREIKRLEGKLTN